MDDRQVPDPSSVELTEVAAEARKGRSSGKTGVSEFAETLGLDWVTTFMRVPLLAAGSKAI